MKRAYSTIVVKEMVKADDGQRIIRGIATTPAPDRMGDIVEPLGVSFKNPVPLLRAHNHREPVGEVRFSKPTAKGVEFEARLPKIDEPGTLKDRVDTAWQEIKAGLIKAVSIGFRSLEHAVMENGGYRFIKSELMELSLVAIPANAEATIQLVKSVGDRMAAPGRFDDARPLPAPRDRSTPKGDKAMKPITEQIADFRATLKTKADRMDAILATSAETGSTLDSTQQQEYDDLAAESDAIVKHIDRLEAHEKRMKATAVTAVGADPAAAAASREGIAATPGVHVVTAKKLPPGTAFTRYVMALAASRGNILQAVAMADAQKHWAEQTPQVLSVLKAAVAAGTTTDSTWAAPLVEYQVMAEEFIEYLRPRTVIGRIPGLRRVPFKIKVPRQTAGASVNWVGEGKVKPVSSLAFDSVSLDHFKIAGIIALTDELVRFSNPSAEALVREDLANSIIEFMDGQFLDPTKSEAAGVSPASITYGVTPVPASGTNSAAFRTDVKALFQKFIDAEISPEGAVWVMTQGLALALSLMQNALGQPEFPTINMNGGTLLGLPVITSSSVPATGGSPTDGSMLALIAAPQVMLADDGEILIDASREASLQMNDAPDSPATASTVLVSLWQHNMVGIKAERFVNWKKRRDDAVQYISYAKYSG